MGMTDLQAMGTLNGLSLQQQMLYNPTNDAMNIGVIGFVNTIFISLLTAATITIVPRLRRMRGGELSHFATELGIYLIMTAILILGISLMAWREIRASRKVAPTEEASVQPEPAAQTG